MFSQSNNFSMLLQMPTYLGTCMRYMSVLLTYKLFFSISTVLTANSTLDQVLQSLPDNNVEVEKETITAAQMQMHKLKSGLLIYLIAP